MKIILVRHGLTQANINKTYSVNETRIDRNNLDILDRTKSLLENYKIDQVYTSALIRSQETANYLGFNDFIIDPRLNEMDFGDFKGQNLIDVRENYKDFFQMESKNYFDTKYPNGESRNDLIKRLGEFLDEKSQENKNILCFSHGIAIRASLFWLLKDLENWSSFWIDNGSLTVFNIKDQKRLIESVNLI